MSGVVAGLRKRLAEAIGMCISDTIADRLEAIADIDGVTYIYATSGDVTISTEDGYTLTLASTVFDDLRVPLSTIKPGAAAPDYSKFRDNGSGSTGVFAYMFDKTTEQEMTFDVQIPHSAKLNTKVVPHIHGSPMVNGAAGKLVNWGLEVSQADIGAVFPETTIIYANDHIPNDSSLVQYKHYLWSFGELDGTGASVSSMMKCRVFRDAAGNGGTDDLDGDCAGHEVDFHVEINRLGSPTQYS